HGGATAALATTNRWSHVVAGDVLNISVAVAMTSVFFFQAEDGIRDGHVTGVQTCALPILTSAMPSSGAISAAPEIGTISTSWLRSEERRVGKSVDLGGRRIIKKKKRKEVWCGSGLWTMRPRMVARNSARAGVECTVGGCGG